MTMTLPIEAVIARLKAETTLFRDVDGAAGYDRAREDVRRFPAAYAIPLRELPGPNRYDNCKVGQRVAIQFAVVIIARDLSNDGGVGAVTELEACRSEVHGATLGWEAGETFEATIYKGGLLVSDIGRDGLVAWQATYETAYQLESV